MYLYRMIKRRLGESNAEHKRYTRVYQLRKAVVEGSTFQ